MPQILNVISALRRNGIKVLPLANTHIMTVELAQQVLGGLCEAIDKLTSGMELPLSEVIEALEMSV